MDAMESLGSLGSVVNDGAISAEKLAEVLLNPDNREMIRDIKRTAQLKIEEFNSQIANHRSKIEKGLMRLQAAQTDIDNPRLIEQRLESYKRELTKARETVVRCERQIEILTAQLPNEARTARVEAIKEGLQKEQEAIDSLIQIKGIWRRLHDMIEKAQELGRE